MHSLIRVVLALVLGSSSLWGQARRCNPEPILNELTTDKVCSLDDSRIQAIAKEYGSHRSANCGDSETYRDPAVAIKQVRSMQKESCDARKGIRADALPPFEAAIDAMTDGRELDPCTYDPKADNFAVLNAPLYLDYNNRKSYDDGITYRRLELYLERRADPQRAACFLNFLRSGIVGQKASPPVKTEAPQDPKPATTPAPVPMRKGGKPRQAPSAVNPTPADNKAPATNPPNK